MENERFESEIELFKKYSSDIARIIDSERSRTEGIEGEVRFKKEELGGKHQMVYSVSYMFPEGEVQAVEKHRGNPTRPHNGANLERIMEKFPVVKDIYPAIFYNNEGAHISEKINGYESKELQEFIYSSPEAMEQLLKEAYEMFDPIFKEELDLAGDICLFGGWNIIYDLEQERFRLFDSDTVFESTKNYHTKMFKFFEGVATTATRRSQDKPLEVTEGLIYLMNRFFQENPQLIDAETENDNRTGKRWKLDGEKAYKEVVQGKTHKLNQKVVELVQEKDTEGLFNYLNSEETYPIKYIDKTRKVIGDGKGVERHGVTIPVNPEPLTYGSIKEIGKPSICIDTKEEFDKLLLKYSSYKIIPKPQPKLF